MVSIGWNRAAGDRMLTDDFDLFADSIYTERYMNLPSLNPGGYVNASISNVTGFKDVDFLLAHGSGDDNVHYANSAHLLDMFTAAQVRKFRFRMFTDRCVGF
jgi:dipeptidyl aminopeptidase B